MSGLLRPEKNPRYPFLGSGVFFRLLLGVLAVLALTGCLSKRSAYDVPDVPVAAKYKNAPVAPAAPEKSEEKSEEKPVEPVAADAEAFAEWWRYFGNRELEGLIYRGMANNPDVRIATLRLVQAKTRADQADAGFLPTLSAPLTMARQAPGGTVGSVPVGSSGRAPQTSIQSSLKGDFRLDVWGEQSALAESAQLQLRRAALERDNVQRNVVASIANSYVELLALNDRLAIARETERVLTDTLQTVERRLQMGDATLGELEQQKATIFGLRAAIPGMEQQREDAVNALAFLVGTLPGSLQVSTLGLSSLSVPEVEPGLPSSLLLRRPDVRMMEARLLAADADIDVARARILPPVDLAAQAGYSSNALAQLFMPKAFFWNAVASLTASIFDGGRRENEKKFNEAIYEEMVETYIRTIYQAMREVEGSLATVRLAGRRLDAQREAAEAARKAWQISLKVYAMGGLDHLALLESERTFHRYQDDYQRAQMDHYKGYVALFNALGGGVKPAPVLPGKGKRPSQSASGKAVSNATAETTVQPFSVDGVDVSSDRKTSGYWLIELPGLYHRAAVSAAWRDLLARYPEFMQGRMLRPRLDGSAEKDGMKEAWYRLSIAQFADQEEARAFCNRLMSEQDRCQVVYSRTGEQPPAPVKKPSVPPVLSEKPALPVVPDPPVAAVVPDKVPESTPLAPTSAALETVQEERAVPFYTIQLGAFSNPENAAVSSAVWQFRGYEPYIAEHRSNDGRLWYVVRTGQFKERKAGLAASEAIRQKEEMPVLLVSAPANAAGSPLSINIEPLLAQRLREDSPVLPEPPESLSEPVQANARVVSVKSGGKARKVKKPKSTYAVQLGAFASRDNARLAGDYWQARGLTSYLALLLDPEGRPWYAVRSGEFASRREAAALALQLGRKENVTALVVPANSDAVLASEAPEIADLPVKMSVEEQKESVVVSPTVSAPALADTPAPAKPAIKTANARYSVQLGAFSTIENAAKAFAEWQARGYEPYVCETDDVRGNLRFAVRTGEFSRKLEGQQIIRAIQRQDNVRAVLVPALLNAAGELQRIDVSPLLPNSAVDLPPSAELALPDVR